MNNYKVNELYIVDVKESQCIIQISIATGKDYCKKCVNSFSPEDMVCRTSVFPRISDKFCFTKEYPRSMKWEPIIE